MKWWELWTCHLMHWDARHLILNVVAALPPLAMAPPDLRRRLFAWAFLPAPLLGIVAAQAGGEYRGASGLVVALWALVGAYRRSGWMLGCLGAKLLAEAFGFMPASHAFVTLTSIHYAGAAAGLLSAYLFHSSRMRRPMPA